MRKLMTIMSLLLLLTPSIALEESTSTAGTLPDSILYFWDVAMDNMALYFTTDVEAKLQLLLDIANERILEAQALIDSGSYLSMEQAITEFGKIKIRLETEMARIDLMIQDEAERLRLKLELENAVNELDLKIKTATDELLLKLKADLILTTTPEEAALIEDIAATLPTEGNELKVKVNDAINRTKIQLNSKGINADELEARIGAELGLTTTWSESALNAITEAEQYLTTLNQSPSEIVSGLSQLDQAQQSLTTAQESLNGSPETTAIDALTEAQQTITNAQSAINGSPDALVNQLSETLDKAKLYYNESNYRSAESVATEIGTILSGLI